MSEENEESERRAREARAARGARAVGGVTAQRRPEELRHGAQPVHPDFRPPPQKFIPRRARLRDNCVLNLMTRKPTDGRSPARCFSAPKNWLAPLRMKLRTSWGSSAKRAGVRAI